MPLCSLGGDLSFYIGINLLSFLEVGEFLVRLAAAQVAGR
jgi:hypothetical protein